MDASRDMLEYYARRRREYERMYGFPERQDELADALAGLGAAPSYQQGQYYWTLKYQTPR